MYTPGTIANLKRVPTKINKNGAIAKGRVLVEQVILEDIFLTTFRIITKETSVLLFVLC